MRCDLDAQGAGLLPLQAGLAALYGRFVSMGRSCFWDSELSGHRRRGSHAFWWFSEWHAIVDFTPGVVSGFEEGIEQRSCWEFLRRERRSPVVRACCRKVPSLATFPALVTGRSVLWCGRFWCQTPVAVVTFTLATEAFVVGMRLRLPLVCQSYGVAAINPT